MQQADNETSEKAPLLPSAASAEALQSKAVKDIGAAPNAAAAPPAPATDSVAASNPAGLERYWQVPPSSA